MAFDLQESIAVLQATPKTVRALLGALPKAWLEVNEGPDSWSPRDILGHFIHGEDTDWIPRAEMILAGATVPFPPFDRFAQFQRFAGMGVPELLDRFERRRRENLGILAGWRLGPADLVLPGIHPDFGPVTLGELLATWVVHDLNHVAQIARVMAKRYANVVGPWQAYLPILTR
jgi:hypothetical protein